MRTTRALTALLLVVLLSGGATAALGQESQTGMVTVVHGLRGFLADLYLDGDLVLEGFRPERTTDPMQVSAGRHRFAIRAAGEPASSKPALAGAVNVDPGSNWSLVAHQSPAGEPTLSVFDNDTSAVPSGQARVVIRHTADAPPIDVRVDQAAFVQDLAPTRQSGGRLDAVSHDVVVANANGQGVLVPPSNIQFVEGASNLLYLIGSAENRSVGWLAQTIDGLDTAPSGVPTGTSGLAARPGFPLTAVGLLLLAGLLGGGARRTA